MKNYQNAEIKKYVKLRTAFQMICVISGLAILIYSVTVIATRQNFDVYCIVAVSVLGCYILLSLTITCALDKCRKNLVKKYFGEVSAEDIEKSKYLLSKICCAKSGKYDFLQDEHFEFDMNTLKGCLKQISKGYKVFYGLVSVFFDIGKKIEAYPENIKNENSEFNILIFELVDLFGRNTSEI